MFAACLANRAGKWNVGRTADLVLQVVREILERVEPDDPRSVGDEIREGVDVVVVDVAVAVIDYVLDAADVDAGGPHDALDVLGHFGRRLIAFDLEPSLRGFDDAGVFQTLSGRGLTDICRAQVKSFAGQVHFDRVEIVAAQGFHARDETTPAGNELLHHSDP